MTNKHIPTISSGIAGPAGILHLPRLWQKVSLSAVDKLNDAYPCCGNGFDQMVLDALNINRAEFLAFVASKKPTYPETETWIINRCAGTLDRPAIEKLNDSISTYLHSPTTRAEILNDARIAIDSPIEDAVTLNNLDDWNTFWNENIIFE